MKQHWLKQDEVRDLIIDWGPVTKPKVYVQDQNGQWYFVNETFTCIYGPFENKRACQDACMKYIKEELGV